MGVEPLDTVTWVENASALGCHLSLFDAVLVETVVGAVAGEETVSAYLAVLSAAAPR